MRADAATVLLVASAVSAIGCIGRDKDPMDPSDFLHGVMSETEERVEHGKRVPRHAPAGDPRKTVRVACDEEGNLHVRAPDGSTVTRPDDAANDAEAEIAFAEPARPIRRSRSLGFIGDGKLGESRSYGGPWNAPDAVLPKHVHHQPSYGRGSYGYRSYRPSWGYRYR
jgi:hypothetical protein